MTFVILSLKQKEHVTLKKNSFEEQSKFITKLSKASLKNSVLRLNKSQIINCIKQSRDLKNGNSVMGR